MKILWPRAVCCGQTSRPSPGPGNSATEVQLLGPRYEAALRLLAVVFEGICVLDCGCRLSEPSAELANLLGRDIKELEGASLADFLASEDKHHLRSLDAALSASSKSGTYGVCQSILQDGVPVQIFFVRLDEGGVARLLVGIQAEVSNDYMTTEKDDSVGPLLPSPRGKVRNKRRRPASQLRQLFRDGPGCVGSADAADEGSAKDSMSAVLTAAEAAVEEGIECPQMLRVPSIDGRDGDTSGGGSNITDSASGSEVTELDREQEFMQVDILMDAEMQTFYSNRNFRDEFGSRPTPSFLRDYIDEVAGFRSWLLQQREAILRGKLCLPSIAHFGQVTCRKADNTVQTMWLSVLLPLGELGIVDALQSLRVGTYKVSARFDHTFSRWARKAKKKRLRQAALPPGPPPDSKAHTAVERSLGDRRVLLAL
mmetsp:Transcript_63310/g.181633  ORF Transcript_63310/g.181633 Transcript_63310/m.181633 type:complete len:426 (-) Transcript_63310:21-1298(-)